MTELDGSGGAAILASPGLAPDVTRIIMELRASNSTHPRINVRVHPRKVAHIAHLFTSWSMTSIYSVHGDSTLALDAIVVDDSELRAWIDDLPKGDAVPAPV
jgi:hypothetical protein